MLLRTSLSLFTFQNMEAPWFAPPLSTNRFLMKAGWEWRIIYPSARLHAFLHFEPLPVLVSDPPGPFWSFMAWPIRADLTCFHTFGPAHFEPRTVASTSSAPLCSVCFLSAGQGGFAGVLG